MGEKVLLKIGGKEKEYDAGVTYLELAKEYANDYDAPIILAMADGKLTELYKSINKNAEIKFVTIKDKAGMMTYRRTAMLMLHKAVVDVVQNHDDNIHVLYSMDQAFYCELFRDNEKVPIDQSFVDELNKYMKEYVEKDIVFKKYTMSVDEAIESFNKFGLTDKARLLKYRGDSRINMYDVDGFIDYSFGYIAPSTGMIKVFEITLLGDGFLINFPSYSDVHDVDVIDYRPKLFDQLHRASKWVHSLDIATLGALNDRIASGDMTYIILAQEAEMEKRIGEIAQRIAGDSDKKFVMIAGPSSSGKTTFSHRLSIQLMAMGLKPHPIALDDFFVNRADMIPLPDGSLDFEALDAMDIEGFNNAMNALLRGEVVDMPTYNFITGKREYNGNKLQIGEDDILVIEGIHGLNDKLSYSLPEESKFKIYISALTPLKIDEHNFISTRDSRLIRRIVRDNRTRGHNALASLDRWDSVTAGEDKHIFPFQENADIMFNSALIYELPVLKPYIEPLLYAIPRDSKAYPEAKRLLKMLSYCLPYPSEEIAKNSIVREFTGGSCFKV
ncbi:MAG: nucleoside kinase [Eubacterium sp.]|nr:nucleoside kinase [Eubacterium sp.]